jgi:hypothetical protein
VNGKAMRLAESSARLTALKKKQEKMTLSKTRKEVNVANNVLLKMSVSLRRLVMTTLLTTFEP